MTEHKIIFFQRWLIPLAIFGLALAIRTSSLGTFTTADEPLWIQRSRWFTAGLFFSDIECPPAKDGRPTPASGLSCTLQSGHPGIITMWSGSLGILAYYWQFIRPNSVDLRMFLQTFPVNHQDSMLLIWMRLPLAILSSVFIALFYTLLRRLLTFPIALLATLLLALHPFHVALSRVLHHDAANTTFMVLSALAMIGYWLRGWRWYWLLFSAMMAGLAFLSKLIGLLLLPYAAVIGGLSLFYRQPRSVWKVLGEGIFFGCSAFLTFAIFFPAMWVVPSQVMAVVFGQNFEMVERGHNHYFLGEVSNDPGPLFYPIGWLWQATPLELIGLLMLPIAGLLWQKQSQKNDGLLKGNVIANHPVEVALLIFPMMLYLLEMSSGKKMIRYFLPAFPMIAIFSTYGLLWLSNSLLQRTNGTHPNRLKHSLLVSIIVLVHGGLLLMHRPYYFTYYNPLLGGPRIAAQFMTVGWGEGLEEAAHRLNNMPNADALVVSSWYNDIFQPYFVGQEASFADDGRAQLGADYVLFYISQIQRQKPYAGFVDYFRAKEPIFTIDAPTFYRDKVHWIEVYKSPAAQTVSGAPEVEGIAQLLAYKITSDKGIELQSDISEDDIILILFLRVLGPLPDNTTFNIALRDTFGNRWGDWQYLTLAGEWEKGNLVEWSGKLRLPADMPPGQYRPWVAFQFEDGPVIAEFAISDKNPTIEIYPFR
ncbi:glycosyltransferase family 39 protein [Anaerolineales bacterium HSG24]|nr:glycosyltransferase family 39 protein [Anaerolineales bacterium HSG24]